MGPIGVTFHFYQCGLLSREVVTEEWRDVRNRISACYPWRSQQKCGKSGCVVCQDTVMFMTVCVTLKTVCVAACCGLLSCSCQISGSHNLVVFNW